MKEGVLQILLQLPILRAVGGLVVDAPHRRILLNVPQL